jgi:hypothetical protein
MPGIGSAGWSRRRFAAVFGSGLAISPVVAGFGVLYGIGALQAGLPVVLDAEALSAWGSLSSPVPGARPGGGGGSRGHLDGGRGSGHLDRGRARPSDGWWITAAALLTAAVVAVFGHRGSRLPAARRDDAEGDPG